MHTFSVSLYAVTTELYMSGGLMKLNLLTLTGCIVNFPMPFVGVVLLCFFLFMTRK